MSLLDKSGNEIRYEIMTGLLEKNQGAMFRIITMAAPGSTSVFPGFPKRAVDMLATSHRFW